MKMNITMSRALDDLLMIHPIDSKTRLDRIEDVICYIIGIMSGHITDDKYTYLDQNYPWIGERGHEKGFW